MSEREKHKGVYAKFRTIERTDGTSAPGEKHHGCAYFVLDLDHDPHAMAALRAYADSCEGEYPSLARDLREVSDAHPDGSPASATGRATTSRSSCSQRNTSESSPRDGARVTPMPTDTKDSVEASLDPHHLKEWAHDLAAHGSSGGILRAFKRIIRAAEARERGRLRAALSGPPPAEFTGRWSSAVRVFRRVLDAD